MSEPEISGEIVPAPPAAEMRYDEEDPVTRVFLRVERRSGKILECQARDPQDFKMNDPRSISSMVLRESKGRISAGGLFTPVKRMLPSLDLSFVVHPKWGMHIRTEATAPAEFPGITYG